MDLVGKLRLFGAFALYKLIGCLIYHFIHKLSRDFELFDKLHELSEQRKRQSVVFVLVKHGELINKLIFLPDDIILQFHVISGL